MIFLLKIDDQNTQPYKSLRNKIKTFSSICAAVNFFTESSYSETDFLEKWGDNVIRFFNNEKFYEVFGIGFTIWTDDKS